MTHARRFLLLLAVAMAIAALLAVRGQAAPWLATFAAWVQALGAWAPLVFAAGYALAVVALVPGSLLTLAGGALFGLWLGTAVVFGAATLGACAAFLVSRHLARGWVER